MPFQCPKNRKDEGAYRKKYRIEKDYPWIKDSQRKILICIPPKTGCTALTRFHFALKFNNETYLKDRHKFISSDKVYEMTPRLQKTFDLNAYIYKRDNWTTIIHTRHPFERLYSAYKDKFNSNHTRGWNAYWSKTAEKIKTYETADRKETVNEASGISISFTSFLEYLLDTPT